MNTRPVIAALLLALPLALAACKQEAEKDATASGEILPGSASDAMLPEDRLTSQPPLDPRAVRTGTAAQDEVTADVTGAPEGGAPEAATTAAPAPTTTKAAE